MADSDRAWPLVQDAILAFGSKVPDLAKARVALTAVISEGAWQAYAPPIGQPCSYTNFSQWVEAGVPRGLETTVENLLSIAEGDTKLRDALDEVLRRPHGGDHRSAAFNVNNINIERPQGTSQAQAMRRLRKESDHGNEQAARLHAEVLAGQISANAAMVKAGFRPKMVSVPIGRPERIAAYLRKHMPREALARLISLLSEPEDKGEG